MAHHTITDRTLALAGVFQAAGLVQQIANRGSVDPQTLEVCIRSLLEVNPATTEAVYGGAAGVRSGLEGLLDHLSGKQSLQKTQVVKYVLGILYLERQLAKKPIMLERISTAVERARLQITHFSITHSNVLAGLAGCYTDTISTLTPRIIVTGEQGHLSNPEVANTVRSLLLAAIRSAVLWRQCGGNRIQLLFGRRKLLIEAQRLLKRF
jgi:high frequency lysogenization protein